MLNDAPPRLANADKDDRYPVVEGEWYFAAHSRRGLWVVRLDGDVGWSG